jgi:hypothetical protein
VLNYSDVVLLCPPIKQLLVAIGNQDKGQWLEIFHDKWHVDFISWKALHVRNFYAIQQATFQA